MTDVIVVEVEAPQNPTKAIDLSGQQGDPGDNGLNGWSPVFSTVVDGERRVQRIINWTGGAGTKPTVGQYVGATSLVDDIADAVDIRGPAGVEGAAGPAGQDGAVVIGGDTAVITGEGVPDDSMGIDEQLYFDTLTSDLYQKKAGHWVLQARLKGAQGDKGDKGDTGAPGADGVVGVDGAPGVNGSTIRYGAGAPNDATGANGDAYLRTSNADYYVKTSGVYAVVVNLKGPAGATGAKGDKGDQGIQGPAGDTGAKGDPGPSGSAGAPGADGAPGPTLTPRGLWSSITAYAAFDSVRINGQGSYYALAANTNKPPEANPTAWVLYASDGVDGADGAPGAPGADGAQGIQGVQGPKGDKGDKGDTGSAGAKGDPGDNAAMTLASKSANYTTVLADANNAVLHPSSDTTARTFTIDSNANVPYPIGTILTFINQNAAGVLTIAIASDTMRLAEGGATGSRALVANGVANAVKLSATEWIISGVGLS